MGVWAIAVALAPSGMLTLKPHRITLINSSAKQTIAVKNVYKIKRMKNCESTEFEITGRNENINECHHHLRPTNLMVHNPDSIAYPLTRNNLTEQKENSDGYSALAKNKTFQDEYSPGSNDFRSWLGCELGDKKCY